MEIITYKLRPLAARDAARMVEMMQDEQTIRYLQIGGPDYTEETALRFIERAKDETEHLHRAVVDENDVYQGTISLKNIDLSKKEAEYAISMHPQAQGKGAAAAATKALLRIAFHKMGLKRVYLNVLQENKRANRFYQKHGFLFTHVGTLSCREKEMLLNWYEILEYPESF